MNRSLILIVPLAMSILGAAMLIEPRYIVSRNRDGGDADPITPWDVTKTRILGVVFLAMAAFILYAVLTGTPGAEFFPA